MPREKSGHSAYVENWLIGTAKGLPPDQLIALFERAFEALWRRADRTLGEVTLTAIGNRVLFIASEKYPFLSTLKIDDTGIRFDEFRRQEAVARDRRLREGVRFVLVEFLTVLGNLTDEIVSPALHAELSKVVLDQPTRGSKRAQHAPGDEGVENVGAEEAKS